MAGLVHDPAESTGPTPPRPASPPDGDTVSGPGYPGTPLLARLTPANGWRHDVVGDNRGALVAVRIGPVWSDSVAIVGEDQTLAMRHRTNDDRLILPAELPSESRAV